MKAVALTLVLLAAILARATPVVKRCEFGSSDIVVCAREADTQASSHVKRNLFARQFDDFRFSDIFDGGFDFGFGSSDSSSEGADTAGTEDPLRQSNSSNTNDTASTPANTAALTSNTCAAGSTPPNAATLSLIKEFEGFEPAPAPDPIGLPTVGFGHKCQQSGCAEVPFSFPLSQSTATSLLASDAQTFVDCLHAAISDNVVLNDNQFGALTAFAFNVGCGAVRKSTLLRRLNAGEDADTVASQELPKFNKAGGKVLAGLTRRRAAEVALFQTASSTVAHPLC